MLSAGFDHLFLFLDGDGGGGLDISSVQPGHTWRGPVEEYRPPKKGHQHPCDGRWLLRADTPPPPLLSSSGRCPEIIVQHLNPPPQKKKSLCLGWQDYSNEAIIGTSQSGKILTPENDYYTIRGVYSIRATMPPFIVFRHSRPLIYFILLCLSSSFRSAWFLLCGHSVWVEAVM